MTAYRPIAASPGPMSPRSARVALYTHHSLAELEV